VGKHSQRREARTLVGYGVALTAVAAATTLVAGTARADVDWGPIISCESGGNPKAQNPSSTASGLLQFLDTSWQAYGGGKYAARAKDATVAQQYEIANRAYAMSGLSPWAASRGCWGGKVSTNVKPAAIPAATSAASAPKHAAPVLPAYTGPTVDYVAAVDDTLAQIAVAHGIDDWQQIAAANPGLADPDQIQVGQSLKLPAPLATKPATPPPCSGEKPGVCPDSPPEPAVVPLGQPQPVKLSVPTVELKALSTPTVAAVGTSGGVAARAVAAALGKQGVMYSAMDCSALVQYAFRAAGVSLPRVAKDQAIMGRPVKLTELKPGDVLTYYSPVSHVAIFIGGNKLVESSQSGHPVAVRSMYLNGFAGARRIVG
jgi:cell wall-associated NlpC family hydrolase